MGKQKSSPLIRQLQRAVKKMKSLLHCWRVHSTVTRSSKQRWCRLFNDQMGLRSFLEDEETHWDRTEEYRTTSYASEDDIDERAEVFIANFRRQLGLERFRNSFEAD